MELARGEPTLGEPPLDVPLALRLRHRHGWTPTRDADRSPAFFAVPPLVPGGELESAAALAALDVDRASRSDRYGRRLSFAMSAPSGFAPGAVPPISGTGRVLHIVSALYKLRFVQVASVYSWLPRLLSVPHTSTSGSHPSTGRSSSNGRRQTSGV